MEKTTIWKEVSEQESDSLRRKSRSAKTEKVQIHTDGFYEGEREQNSPELDRYLKIIAAKESFERELRAMELRPCVLLQDTWNHLCRKAGLYRIENKDSSHLFFSGSKVKAINWTVQSVIMGIAVGIFFKFIAVGFTSFESQAIAGFCGAVGFWILTAIVSSTEEGDFVLLGLMASGIVTFMLMLTAISSLPKSLLPHGYAYPMMGPAFFGTDGIMLCLMILGLPIGLLPNLIPFQMLPKSFIKSFFLFSGGVNHPGGDKTAKIPAYYPQVTPEFLKEYEWYKKKFGYENLHRAAEPEAIDFSKKILSATASAYVQSLSQKDPIVYVIREFDGISLVHIGPSYGEFTRELQVLAAARKFLE